jgi:Patatin phospholipase
MDNEGGGRSVRGSSGALNLEVHDERGTFGAPRYRPKDYEGNSKDYEFSRRSMEAHWRAGYCDAVHALRHPEIFERSSSRYETLATFEFGRDRGD